MIYTDTITVLANDPEPVIVPVANYRKVTIRESLAGATAAYRIRGPAENSTAHTKVAGEPTVFTKSGGKFAKNEIVCYVDGDALMTFDMLLED